MAVTRKKIKKAENADDEVKQVSKYVTKSNEDLGVAYTIHELLKKQGKINSDCE